MTFISRTADPRNCVYRADGTVRAMFVTGLLKIPEIQIPHGPRAAVEEPLLGQPLFLVETIDEKFYQVRNIF